MLYQEQEKLIEKKNAGHRVFKKFYLEMKIHVEKKFVMKKHTIGSTVYSQPFKKA